MKGTLPKVFTARYQALDARAARELVPVRVSHLPPEDVIALPYAVAETAPSLVPGDHLLGEWPPLATGLLDRLDFLGIGAVAAELSAISERHGGRSLALLDFGDVTRGVKAARTVAAFWLEEQTGEPVRELLEGGETVHRTEVHRQARFERPRPYAAPREHDRRFARDEHVVPAPLSPEDVERWVASRFWQYARMSPRNPHAYTHAAWGDRRMFLRVCEFVRERGGVEAFGGHDYVHLDLSDRRCWTMGDVAETTFILNCKFHDPEDTARLAEGQTGKTREELGLVFGGDGGARGARPSGRQRPRGSGASPSPTLFDHQGNPQGRERP